MIFELNEEETQKFNDWRNNHNCKQKDVGAIGGRFTFCFTPTSLGELATVKCACGKELDLTNVSDW